MTQKQILHAWAMRYLAMGWNVLPAARKSPVVPWREFQKRKATVKEWDGWKEDPKVFFDQIALVTGRISGTTVLDVDVLKDGSKDHRDPDWVVAQVNDCDAPVSITGGGGRHVFFRFEDIPNSVKIAHPQLDTRSEGGIIILPPSSHDSGEAYQWEDVERIVPGLTLPEFPALLRVAFEKRPQKDWNKILKAGVGEGRRTDVLVSVIGKVLQLAPELPELALDVAIVWNRKCTPPLQEEEVKRTWASMVLRDKAKNMPRDLKEM